MEFITTLDWWIVLITCAFIGLDIISGLIKALATHNVMSGKIWLGIIKKTAYIIIIVLAILCDWAQVYMDLGFTVPLLMAACIIIILGEIASILENVVAINPNIAATKFFALFNISHEGNENGND